MPQTELPKGDNVTGEFRSAVQSLGKRLLDPFVGLNLSFVATWNWKPIAVLVFDERPIYARILFVEGEFFGAWPDYLLRVGIPISIATLYFFLYPPLKTFFVLYHERRALALRAKKADLAALPESQTTIEALKGDQRKLQVIYHPYLELVKQKYRLGKSDTLTILQCSGAKPGLWVTTVGSDTRIASINQLAERKPTGLVLEAFEHGFIVVQHSGFVAWSVFEGLLSRPQVDGTMFLLTDGLMGPDVPAGQPKARVGEFRLTDGSAGIEINFTPLSE